MLHPCEKVDPFYDTIPQPGIRGFFDANPQGKCLPSLGRRTQEFLLLLKKAQKLSIALEWRRNSQGKGDMQEVV